MSDLHGKYAREGQAFPGPKPPDHWGDPSRGMTLRDYFAGQAIQGLVPACIEGAFEMTPDHAAIYAREAYAVADAMMKAREDGE